MANALWLALMVIGLADGRVQQSSTWETAKPYVDKWIAEYKYADRTIAARDSIVVQIRALLDEHRSDIWAYEAAALGFNNLGLNREAVDIMREYLRRFPEDMTLQNRVLFFFGNWGTAADLESRSDRWRRSAAYWQRLLQARVREKAAPGLIEQAGLEVLARVPPSDDPGGNQRTDIAEAWLQQGVSAAAAERVAREAVAISEVGQRPAAVTTDAQQRSILDRLLIVKVNRSTLGWALYHQGRYSDAAAELRRAARVLEEQDVNARAVYYRLGRTLEKLADSKGASAAYLKELAWGSERESTQAALRELYQREHGTVVGFEAMVRERVNELVAKRAQTAVDLVRDTDEDLGRFELLDTKGRPLNLVQYRGKVVIIEFWATWCGSCRPSLEHTDRIRREFDGKLVVVAPSWDAEETRGRAEPFLREKGYEFLLVFDDENRRAIRLPFIPARLLLDRGGRLRFLEFGYTPASAALFEDKVRTILQRQ